MSKLPSQEALKLLRDKGLTLRSIAEEYNVTRQAVQQKLNPERIRRYEKTDKMKAYHRHLMHRDSPNAPFDNCERCQL